MKKRKPKSSWKSPIKLVKKSIRFSPKIVEIKDIKIEETWTGFDNT